MIWWELIVSSSECLCDDQRGLRTQCTAVQATAEALEALLIATREQAREEAMQEAQRLYYHETRQQTIEDTRNLFGIEFQAEQERLERANQQGSATQQGQHATARQDQQAAEDADSDARVQRELVAEKQAREKHNQRLRRAGLPSEHPRPFLRASRRSDRFDRSYRSRTAPEDRYTKDRRRPKTKASRRCDEPPDPDDSDGSNKDGPRERSRQRRHHRSHRHHRHTHRDPFYSSYSETKEDTSDCV
jgi:hypothetical protein